MADTLTAKSPRKQTRLSFNPHPQDEKIIAALKQKLGVDTSQIFRLGIRALAAKEGVAA